MPEVSSRGEWGRRLPGAALVVLLAAPPPAARPPEPTAVLAEVEGGVTLSSPGRAGERGARRAARRQVVAPGEVVHLPEGARATAICSVETLVRLAGPGDWRLDAAACARGVSLPASSYRNLTAFAGRVLPRGGALLLELEARTVDLTAGPVLLSPRTSAVRDLRPLLLWTRVPSAFEYEIEIRGDVQTSVQVAARGLPCAPGSGLWRDLEVCAWTPSGSWPPLSPGQEVRLRLGYRERPGSPLVQAQERYAVRILGGDEEREVAAGLERIASLPLDEAARFRLAAGLRAGAGLLADAVSAYEAALRLEEVPEARVTLGDLLLADGLPTLAAREYERVLLALPEEAVRAAAESGLGQADYQRKRFREARERFERAAKIYASLGLEELAAEARAAAASL